MLGCKGYCNNTAPSLGNTLHGSIANKTQEIEKDIELLNLPRISNTKLLIRNVG